MGVKQFLLGLNYANMLTSWRVHLMMQYVPRSRQKFSLIRKTY